MAKDDECLEAILAASGGKLKREDAEDQLEAVQRGAALYRMKGLSDAEAISRASQDALSRDSIVAERARMQALLNLQKRVDLRRRFEGGVEELRSGHVTGKNMYDSMEAVISGSQKPFTGSRQSLAVAIQSAREELAGAFSNELSKTGYLKPLLKGELDEDLARELWELSLDEGGKPGVTGNKGAIATSEVFHSFGRSLLKQLNDEGSWIGTLPGYVTRNEHNWEKIMTRGNPSEVNPEWKQEIERRFGNDKTFGGMDKVERDNFIKNVYNSIVSGTHTGEADFKAPAFGGPGNIAKRLSQSRLLHANSADDWFSYWKKFGTSNTLTEAMLGTLHRGARNVALMRQFGTNPLADFEKMLSNAKAHYRDISPFAPNEFEAKYETKIRRLFDEVSGLNYTPQNRLSRDIGEWNRVYQQITHLGQVVFAHGSVPVTRALSAHYWGEAGGVIGQYGDFFKSLATKGHAATEGDREILDLLRARNEGQMHDLLSKAGYGSGGPGAASSIANTHMKLTGLPYLMESNKRGHLWAYSRLWARHLDKSFEALDTAKQQLLKSAGIAPEEWNLVRQSTPAEHDGMTFFHPDMASQISDSAAADIMRSRGMLKAGAAESTVTRTVERFRNDLSSRIAMMFSDEGNRALNIPQARTRALLNQGTPRGSVPGEVMRALTQFKQWPTEIYQNVIKRGFYNNPKFGDKLLFWPHFLAGLTAAGYLRMSLRNLASGIKAPDINGATLAQSFVEGGAATAIGDVVNSMLKQRDFPSAALHAIGGPTTGTLTDVGQIGWDAAHGKNVRNKSGDLLFRQIPFANLFYTKLLVNYLFLWSLHDMIHPGWSQRYEAAVKRETGSPPFIGPARH